MTQNVATTTQTAREYLAGLTGTNGQPLAKSGPGVRGRFSNEAVAALDAARASGVVFADDVKVVKVKVEKPKVSLVKETATVVAAPVDTTGVDPKEVRAWARNVGKNIGQRGRIHSSIIAEYVAANGTQKRVEVRRPTPNDMPKRRPENSGYVVEKGTRGSADTLFRFDKCNAQGCKAQVSRCACEGGPKAPTYKGTGLQGQALTLDKPVA